MKKMILLIAFLVALTILAIAQQRQQIARDNTHFREGPGSYFPLIGVLAKGINVSVVKEEDGWLQVNCENQQGWISQNAVGEDAAGDDAGSLDAFSFDEGPAMISRASASGAVKGFAQKYVSMKHVSGAFVDYFDKPLINAREYQAFKQETYKDRNARRIRNRYRRLKNNPDEFHVSSRQEKIGFAAAAQVASQGLVMDEARLRYLNNVGNLIVENTELYYYPIKFFILKDSRPAAYATPVGMIFITQGLLSVVKNEAELAGLLAHEVTHVICQHGYREMDKRKEMVVAEGAFGELEEESPEMSEDEADLEELAYSIFEAATAPRQIEYEYEADRMGAVYAYRAGYDPDCLIDVLKRIEANTAMDYENFESNWEAAYIKDRVGRLEKFVKSELSGQPSWNVRNQTRFNQNF